VNVSFVELFDLVKGKVVLCPLNEAPLNEDVWKNEGKHFKQRH